MTEVSDSCLSVLSSTMAAAAAAAAAACWFSAAGAACNNLSRDQFLMDSSIPFFLHTLAGDESLGRTSSLPPTLAARELSIHALLDSKAGRGQARKLEGGA